MQAGAARARRLMPAITYSDFSGGLDRRLPINVQEANRLWVLQNAYVTLGKRIAKRPGLRLINRALAGSFGLENISGRLNVFASVGSTYSPPTGVFLKSLDIPSGYASDSLLGVTYADIFNGFPYVVGYYETVEEFVHWSGPPTYITFYVYRHHYLDGSNTVITDVNCPRSMSACKAASRVFAPNGETVRYCKAGSPRDWTTASDAGFLSVALQQDTKEGSTAVGSFGNSLVVFFPDGAQIWTVAVDPSTNALAKRIHGVGSNAPLSLAAFANDLMFLSPYGFRSMTVQAVIDRIDDTDVGVAVDKLVVPDNTQVTQQVLGIWINELGQYWATFNTPTGTTVWAYTFSRSSKVACWSRYTFPIVITGITTSSGKVYVRDATALYELAVDQFTDDGALIDVEVQMAYQNAKTPGVEKQVYGADFVFEGTADVSFKYDPRDQSKESIFQAISGDTAPGQIVPVEIVATSIAPVIRHSADEAFEFTQMSLYYNALLVT
jgi:hypothetical protein